MPRMLQSATIGALIIRIGLWGILYYTYNKEPPQNSAGNHLNPYMIVMTGAKGRCAVLPAGDSLTPEPETQPRIPNPRPETRFREP